MDCSVGKVIKMVASAIAVLGIGASIIFGYLFNAHLWWVGSLIIIIGSISTGLVSLILYGFGQLIENSDILVDNMEKLLHNNDVSAAQARNKR